MEPFVVDGALLTDIIKCYKGGDKFYFSKKIINFNVKEVALVIDLSSHGKKVAASKVLKGRLLDRFGTNIDLQHKEIERYIGLLKNFKK